MSSVTEDTFPEDTGDPVSFRIQELSKTPESENIQVLLTDHESIRVPVSLSDPESVMDPESLKVPEKVSGTKYPEWIMRILSENMAESVF